MLRSVLTLVLCMGTLVLSAVHAQQNPVSKIKYSRVQIRLDQVHTMKFLAAAGLAVDHGKLEKGRSFTTDLSEPEIKKLQERHVGYSILIDDVSGYYARQLEENKNPGNQYKPTAPECSPAKDYPVPGGFLPNGSMGGHFTYQQVLDRLDTLAARFPGLVTARQPVGTFLTAEGRPLYWLRISDNPNTDEAGETKVLHTALHHAREPMGMMQQLYFMYYLCENYNTDPEVKYFVDHAQIYFIPVVNPDGYVYNEATNPGGGGLWRKNRRNNGDGTFGVDLNRNYNINWDYNNLGSSPNTDDDTYRGPSAFSEPETQAIKYFCEQHHFVSALNYHAFSDMLIFPWGHENMQTPDSVRFGTHAKLMTDYNHYHYGNPSETVGYTGNGGAEDWMYTAIPQKPASFAYTPEVGGMDDGGFWPDQSQIIIQSKECMQINMNFMRAALSYAQVDDIGSTFITQQHHTVKFCLKSLGVKAAPVFTVSVEPLTANITAGAGKVITNPVLFNNTIDSISLTLASGIQHGDVVRYIINVHNGTVNYRDTVTKWYTNSINTVFASDCNSLTGWAVNNGWNTTTEQFLSPANALTESPGGNYANSADKQLTTGEIDLSNAAHASLRFAARWLIEPVFDYVFVQVSKDNGSSYTNLCTRKTRNLGEESGISGLQYQWAYDGASLDEFVGSKIRIRFLFKSDSYLTKDGFYLEDVSVEAMGTGTNSVGDREVLASDIDLYPNPADQYLNLNVRGDMMIRGGTWQLMNVLGQELGKGTLKGAHNIIPLNGLAPAIYIIKVMAAGQQAAVFKVQKR